MSNKPTLDNLGPAARKRALAQAGELEPKRSKVKGKRGMIYIPEIVTAYFMDCGLPPPVYEFRFHPTRKWRLDVAWVPHRIAIEVQGGIFIAGRHVRGAALLKEWEKLNMLTVMGWRVLFCQPKDLCTMETVDLVKKAMGIWPKQGRTDR